MIVLIEAEMEVATGNRRLQEPLEKVLHRLNNETMDNKKSGAAQSNHP